MTIAIVQRKVIKYSNSAVLADRNPRDSVPVPRFLFLSVITFSLKRRRVEARKFHVAPYTMQSSRSAQPSNARHLININKNRDEMVIHGSSSLWMDCEEDVKRGKRAMV